MHASVSENMCLGKGNESGKVFFRSPFMKCVDLLMLIDFIIQYLGHKN